jgi:hypothetical protein
LIEGPPPRWLIEQGFLCRFELFAADAQINVEGVRTVRGDYDVAALQKRVVGIAGDVVGNWQKLNTERMPTLCVGVTVSHAKELAAAHAALAEATDKVNEIEASILNGGYLGLTGTNLSIRERLPKTDAKSLYCLDDSDLRGLSVTYGRGMMGNASENYLPEELLRAAEAKHGGPAGFLERRRKQQQRTRKKDLDEWKGKRASAQAAVARLAPLSSRNAGGAAAAASSSSSAVTSVPSSSGGGGKAKAPATSTPTTVGEAAAKKSAFAVLMKTGE